MVKKKNMMHLLGLWMYGCMDVWMLKDIVDPPFCPPSTCPIRYFFRILHQFPGGPLLLVSSIFSKSPWGLWLRDLSNPVVTLGSLNLDLGSLRYSYHHLRPI